MSDGRCIPVIRVCNGVPECEDQSDEAECGKCCWFTCLFVYMHVLMQAFVCVCVCVCVCV